MDESHFHDLRHTFAVTSLYASDDIKAIQENCVRRFVKSSRPAGLSICSAEIEQWDRPD